ncbi:MAG TPA: hypothetical protein VN257_04010 [Actinotalea sp.]|nr:hypothetical protein [Actinotalea sp.]
MKDLTPEGMAEAIETARYEILRPDRWEDLREAERATRSDLMLRALQNAGITPVLEDLRAAAARSHALAEKVVEIEAARDREQAEHAATREREHAEVAAAREQEQAEHDAEVVRLSDQVTALRQALADEVAAREAAETRATTAEQLVAAIRGLLSGDEAPVPADHGVAAAENPDPLTDNPVPVEEHPVYDDVQRVRWGRVARGSHSS